MFNNGFVAVVAIGVGLIITVTAILADTISKYKLKVEQIKADALVRAEEIRAKNQLELERLMHAPQGDSSRTGINYEDMDRTLFENNNRKSRIKE